jgi:hypothetical protein
MEEQGYFPSSLTIWVVHVFISGFLTFSPAPWKNVLNDSVWFQFGLQSTSEDVDMLSFQCAIFVFQISRSPIELQYYFLWLAMCHQCQLVVSWALVLVPFIVSVELLWNNIICFMSSRHIRNVMLVCVVILLMWHGRTDQVLLLKARAGHIIHHNSSI